MERRSGNTGEDIESHSEPRAKPLASAVSRLGAAHKAVIGWLKSVLASWRAWSPDVMALVLLCGAFIVLFIVAQRSPAGTDDTVYFLYAAGHNTGAPHHHQRFILLGTVQLAQAIFGYTLTAYYAVPFAYSVGLVLSVYFAARALLGVWLSLVAALLVMAMPTFFASATLPLPDIPSTFYLVLGVAVLLRAFKSDDGRVPVGGALLSGVFFSLAVSARESTAPLLLGLAAFPLILRSTRALKVLLIAGATTVLLELLQMAVLWHVFDNPWYRLDAVRSGHLPQMEKFVRTGAGIPKHVQWTYLITRFFEQLAGSSKYHELEFLGLSYWGLLALSIPPAVLLLILSRQRLPLGIFGFAFWSYAALSLIPLSLDPLIPAIRTKERYFLAVLVWMPMLALAAWRCFVDWPFRRPPPKNWARPKTKLLTVACSMYLLIAFGNAYRVLSSTGSLINGRTPLADYYQAAKSFDSEHERVKRVVGPRVLRAAPFGWPKQDREFKPVWRAKGWSSRGRTARAGDFLIIDHHPAQELSSKVLWRAAGASDYDYAYYYIDDLKGSVEEGKFGMVAAERKSLAKFSRARLRVRLDLKASSLEPGPVQVMRLKGDKPTLLARLDWKRHGTMYRIDETTPEFSTKGVVAVFLDLEFKGRGQGKLKRVLVRAIPARSSKD